MKMSIDDAISIIDKHSEVSLLATASKVLLRHYEAVAWAVERLLDDTEEDIDDTDDTDDTDTLRA